MGRKQRPRIASFSAFSNHRAPQSLRWAGICCLILLTGCWSDEAEPPEPLPLPIADPQIVVRPAPPLVAGDFAQVRTCRLIYRATITDLKPGTKARIWMPEPISDSQQRVTREALQTPDTAQAQQDEQQGNAWFYIEAAANDRGEIVCGATYSIERVEGLPGAGEQISEAGLKQFLQADQNLPADAELVSRLKPEIEALKNPSRERFWKLYFAPSAGEPVIISKFRSAETIRQDDADFHRHLVGDCRALGIPARCHTGLWLGGSGPEPDSVTWVEIAIEGRWQGFERSVAWGMQFEPGLEFPTLSPDRVRFSTISEATLTPAPAGTQTQGLVWPYVEVDGKAYATVKTSAEIKELED